MSSNDSARHTISGRDTMLKYFTEIERMVFAAETYCPDSYNVKTIVCTGGILKCPFNHGDRMVCTLKEMREIVGEP